MKGVPHYKKDGTLHKGKMHKHKDGTLMSGTTMGKSSVTLLHYKDLSSTAKAKAKKNGT